MLVNRETKVCNSSQKFVLLLVECEWFIWEYAKQALTSPHSVSGFGTAVVVFRVPVVLTLLRSACAVPPAMTSAPLKFLPAFKQ